VGDTKSFNARDLGDTGLKWLGLPALLLLLLPPRLLPAVLLVALMNTPDLSPCADSSPAAAAAAAAAGSAPGSEHPEWSLSLWLPQLLPLS
jgi:hypothetical protein